ncbi:hypothetical protein LT493_15410 [Streptomyces tricolor]|nr:hypothetical protein [Streptomyces tricolor]
MERSAQLIVAQLALVRTGGVYVPLDGRAPAERPRRMLTEAGAGRRLTRRWLGGDRAAGAARRRRPARRRHRRGRRTAARLPLPPPSTPTTSST